MAKCGATACSASEVCCYGTAGTPSCTASGSCTIVPGVHRPGRLLGSDLLLYLRAGRQRHSRQWRRSGGGRTRRSRQSVRWRRQPVRRWCVGRRFSRAPGGTMSFTAQCQASCGTGSYQLCVSDSECPSGNTCTMGQYTTYCNAMGMGGPANPFGDAGFPNQMNPFGDGGLVPHGSRQPDESLRRWRGHERRGPMMA